MALRREQGPHASAGGAAPLQSNVFAVCVLFGLAMIACTQTAGDGGWYWLVAQGKGQRRQLSYFRGARERWGR